MRVLGRSLEQHPQILWARHQSPRSASSPEGDASQAKNRATYSLDPSRLVHTQSRIFGKLK